MGYVRLAPPGPGQAGSPRRLLHRRHHCRADAPTPTSTPPFLADMRKALEKDPDKRSEVPLGRDIYPYELDATL